MTTFLDAVRQGTATLDQVDDWVARWHDDTTLDGSGLTLRQFLGMTKLQYAEWLRDPNALSWFVRGPRVHNKYHNTAPPDAVYIGRGSVWGNPARIGVDGDRDECCDKFERMVENTPGMKEKIRRELKGRDVECYCKPKRCHGDYLIKVANSKE